jgi:hypothetical protein
VESITVIDTTRFTAMSDEELGTYVAEQTIGVLRRLYELRPYYEELWRRFDALPSGATINGCKTRTEFCERILKRSVRSVQYALHGRNANNVRAQIGDGEETYVEQIRRKYEKYKSDPVLYALILAQAELIDRHDPGAATMEGRIEDYLCRDRDPGWEEWHRASKGADEQ